MPDALDPLRAYLPAPVTDEQWQEITSQAMVEVGSALDNRATKPVATEFIIAGSFSDRGASIKISNLLRNVLDPSKIEKGATFALGGTAFTGAASWIAFLATALTMFATPIGYTEACILHKAWRITPDPPGTVTPHDLAAVGPEIKSEYGIAKVSLTDMQSYLETLRRSGAVMASQRGYVLRERVRIIDV